MSARAGTGDAQHSDESEPTATPGEVAIVLHTHLPWLANHGVWPVGEEWLFQAWGHSWLPVTELLLRLADEGHREVLTLGVTPMVAAQVSDERLRRDLGTWLGGQMWRAEEQRWQRSAPPGVRDLSTHHWRRHAHLLEVHEEVEQRGGLLAVWSELERRDVLELLGGPATHPYLPLMDDPRAVAAQLEVGLAAHEGWSGRRPRGIWAPELGYRPRGRVGDPGRRPTTVDADGTPSLVERGAVRPGLEELYEDAGVEHILVDAPTLVRAAGGRDRDWTTRPSIAAPDTDDDVVHDGVLVGASTVAAHARDLSVAYRVWAPTEGYPGDEWYRDFHARGTFGVHRSYRVTGLDVPAHEKQPYVPELAASRVEQHVEDLVGLVEHVLDPRPGALVVAAYDTELFGHWWYEGPAFLDGVLRAIAAHPRLRTTTLGSRTSRRPPSRRMALPESSWGHGKGHSSWVSEDTRWIWRAVTSLEVATRATVARLPADEVRDRRTPVGAAVAQVARELGQLRCSDWPFMITRGNSEGYATERVEGHATAVRELLSVLEQGTGEELAAATAQRRAVLPAPADVGALVGALLDDEQIGVRSRRP